MSVPRLNRTGYEYRNAGFRMPEDIGKDAVIKNFVDETTSARFQDAIVFTGNSASDGSSNAKNIDINGLNTFTFWLHPLTGALGKYFGSRVQLTFTEGNTVDIEHANFRMAYGDANSHFNARVGVIHPVEGYGGIDLNPVGMSSPLFLTNAANDPSTGSTYFSLLGSNKAVVEVGYTYGGFDFSIAMNNGNFVAKPDPTTGIGTLTSSIGGANVKPSNDPTRSRKDFQIFANQFLGSGQSAISFLYYHGNLTIFEPAGAPAPNWIDTFDRAALFATIQIDKPFLIYAGYSLGTDNKLDPNTGGAGGTFRSAGYFVEPYYRINEDLSSSLRYDYFSPSSSISSNVLTAGTLSVNWLFLNGAQVVFEYQYLHTQGNPTTDGQTVQTALAYAL